MQTETADRAVTDGQRLLVVDDDPAVAELAREFLEREEAVADVTVALGPEEALSVLATGTALDCVVCDFKMPKMDGLELVERVSARRPDLSFVLFTGSADRAFEDRQGFDEIDALVQKRAQRGRYERLVDAVLDVADT